MRRMLQDKKQRNEITKVSSANNIAENMVTTIEVICNATMPKRRRKENRNPVFWWSEEIALLRKNCLAARRKTTRKPEGETLASEYKSIRKVLKTSIKNSKRKCWLELCRAVEKDPWGLPYKIVVKKLVRRKPILGITEPTWARHIVMTLFPKHDERPMLPMARYDVTSDLLFGIHELQQAVKRLKCGTAPGPDGIPNEVLKVVAEMWPELLLNTFNVMCVCHSVYLQRSFPTCWKRQTLVLLNKPNKLLKEPSSYRLLCLLDNMGKLLEQLIAQRLIANLESQGGLPSR